MLCTSSSSSDESDGLELPRLHRDEILEDILEHVERFRSRFKDLNYAALEDDVLKPVLANTFDPEVQVRGFMKLLQPTSAYRDALKHIDNAELRKQITRFADGSSAKDAVGESGFNVGAHPSPGVKHHFSLLTALRDALLCGGSLKTTVKDFLNISDMREYTKNLPVVFEDHSETQVIEAYSDVPFENWGQSVKNTPRVTFLPQTVRGVQNVVRFAIDHGLRVRCAGYRHSWSGIFSQDREVLISLVNLRQVTTLPDPMSIIPGPYTGQDVPDLRTIELKEQVADGKRLCRVGVAVTNEDFRRWAVANDTWTFPVDVILVEVTIGGVNGPICHGAGARHKTISDYVRKVEYVDCNGNLQVVDDPALVKAAAGCFGLLGVVTHITFELDAMSYAVMEPRKVDVELAIPPLRKDDIPSELRSPWFNDADAAEKLQRAKEEFERRANDYYSEWFWFTYQQKAWINTWNTTDDGEGSEEYPSESAVFLQWVEGWIGGVMTGHPWFNAIPGYWQTQLLATLGMASLPPTFGETNTPTIKTSLPNGLHFRRGIQNLRVRDMEFQIPILRDESTGKMDYSIVQRAWWDIIRLVYEYTNNKKDPSSPMRLTLELRIMNGSDVLMAPQKGNAQTASIEVLSVPDAVADEEWHGFIQKVADIWMSYGEEYNVRPHWAKEWQQVKFKGRPAVEYLKNVAYKDQLVEFKDALRRIGEPHGWGLEQLRGRFSNKLWDEIVFS
ncbi:hypothetical protein BDY21DRAFT_185583 [Lineolata rhizophorae]|uniref:FAD-binding PCMH-type domain-containing protein n=1 Tax=Lineolata rhizophorae TaxID=578093 RepID=A0A6A6P8C2_9PEZI|nr:hypothetical protein BDY21DRAFT_185583 [Lineolata rhizophorae]